MSTSPSVGDFGGIEEVKKLQAVLERALVQMDTRTLSSLLTDDFIRTPPTMPATSKAEWISLLESGAVRYASIETKDAKYRGFGTTVLVHAVSRIKGSMGATEADTTVRLLYVWVEQDGGWRLAAVQGNANAH